MVIAMLLVLGVLTLGGIAATSVSELAMGLGCPTVDRLEASLPPVASSTTRGVAGADTGSVPRAPVDAGTACSAFLDDLRRVFGDEGELLWSVAHRLYQSQAQRRGWPPLSAKAFSQGLAAFGCTTRQRDLRAEGRGRPSELVWVAAVTTIQSNKRAA